METPSPDWRCRRRAPRIPLPIEVELTTDDRTVKAIIRDASLDEGLAEGSLGIGLLHRDALPVHQPIPCRTLTYTRLLSEESTVTLVWSRSFGTDGYLSGGRMVFETASVEEPEEAEEAEASS